MLNIVLLFACFLNSHSIEITKGRRVAIFAPRHMKELNEYIRNDEVRKFLDSKVVSVFKIGKNLKIVYTLKNLKL